MSPLFVCYVLRLIEGDGSMEWIQYLAKDMAKDVEIERLDDAQREKVRRTALDLAVMLGIFCREMDRLPSVE